MGISMGTGGVYGGEGMYGDGGDVWGWGEMCRDWGGVMGSEGCLGARGAYRGGGDV